MGFRQGAYAKIWKVEDKGNYSVAQVSISRKNKDTGEYNVEFQDGFVRLVGNAHEAAKSLKIGDNGASIQITSCDVTNKYDAEKQKSYINFTIFGFEIPDGNSTATAKSAGKGKSKSNKTAQAEVENAADDDDLPF